MPGRYTREHEIGRGGMGAVYLGQDTVLGRTVALKQVGMVPGADTVDEKRVLREARTLASLHHPNIVSVYDLYEEAGQHWLVMEYVESRNLTQLVEEHGPVEPDALGRLLDQIADALQAAHRAGVVHRDIKPGNILVTPDGRAKLADFGIARTAGDGTLTQTGMFTGSPAYIAPEVAQGDQSTPASDVWSLGATAYFALTGSQPYTSDGSPIGVLYKVVNDEPPRTDAAGWLGPLLAGTMAKDPQVRWSIGGVREFLRGEGAPSAEHTSVLPVAPTPEPEDDPPTRTLTSGPGGGTGEGGPGAEETGRSRRATPMLLGLLALAVLLVGILIWALVGLSGDDPPPTAAHQKATHSARPSPTKATGSSTPSDTPSPSTTPSARDNAPSGPSPAEMNAFVSDYLATVTSDTRTAWRMLTPGFQDASGGYSGYTGFWDTIQSAEPSNIRSNPSARTVSYDVHYTRTDGSTDDDSTTLLLTERSGNLKILGER